MSQLYDKVEISKHDQLVDDLGDWIDQYNIAGLIVEALSEEWGSATYERGKDLWYRFLERFPRLLSQTSRWLDDPSDQE